MTDAMEAARRYLSADPRGAHLTKGEIAAICRAYLSTPSPAAVERLRGALQECVWAMRADNPAEGWKDAIDEGEAALAQAGPASPVVMEALRKWLEADDALDALLRVSCSPGSLTEWGIRHRALTARVVEARREAREALTADGEKS